MAGTIFGLPLSQQFDDNGDPMVGGLLYIYAANTSTPSTIYEDFGLTAGLELSNPLVLDASGRIPEFWLADGSYRVRLTDAAANEIFDKPSVTALGASSGTSSGGGVAADSIRQTGDFIWQPITGTRSGYVRANARTIGSSSSGADERANADCEDLFTWLWNNCTDTVCPVTGGRGATAAADWAANKKIAVVDMRGNAAFGLDNMGGAVAGVITGATTPGGRIGSETHVIAQANLPNVSFAVSGTAASHTHGAGTYAANSHTHTAGTLALNSSDITNGTSVTRSFSSVSRSDLVATAGQTAVQSVSAASATLSIADTSLTGNTASNAPAVNGTSGASGTLSLTATAASGGSGTGLSTIPPGVTGTWYIKL